MRIEMDGVVYSYGTKQAIHKITLHVDRGEFVGIIGPNGSGKSTVLKNVYRGLVPDRGTVYIDGENLLNMSYKKSALKMAVVGQENEVPFDFLVKEIVGMGRSPHKRLFDMDSSHDKEVVHHALEHMNMEHMAERNYASLSGGEKQRVMIARAVAQECDLLILDEPANHLDIGCQLEIFDFIKRLKVTVLSAMHDLNMAALYCDRLYIMKNGRIVLWGTPEEILTPENIYNVYGVDSCVVRHPVTGKVSITFLPGEIAKRGAINHEREKD